MPDEAVVAVSRTLARMPFWKKESQTPVSNGSNGNGNTEHNNGDCKKTKEKINYKARLEHKQYLVRNLTFASSVFLGHCRSRGGSFVEAPWIKVPQKRYN